MCKFIYLLAFISVDGGKWNKDTQCNNIQFKRIGEGEKERQREELGSDSGERRELAPLGECESVWRGALREGERPVRRSTKRND